jgi:hypothetical protein
MVSAKALRARERGLPMDDAVSVKRQHGYNSAYRSRASGSSALHTVSTFLELASRRQDDKKWREFHK